MASDNLTAAAAGALGSVNDLLSEYVRASIGNKFKKDYMANEMELKNKYEMEQLPVKKQYEFDILGKKAELDYGNELKLTEYKTNEDIRKEQGKLNIKRPIISPTGEVVGEAKGGAYELGFQPSGSGKGKTLASPEVNKIQEYDDLIKDYKNIGDMARKVKPKISPLMAVVPGMAEKVFRSKESNVFTAEADKVFQKFRSKTTGASAGLKELGWLLNDVPSINDKDLDTFLEKSDYTLTEIKKERDKYLENLANAGKDVSNFSKSDFSVPVITESEKTSSPSKGKLRKATMDDF